MPAPTFVNTAARATDTNTTITPALPGSRVNNNLLIAWADVFGSQTGTWTLDATSVTNGWVIFDSVNQGGQRPMVLAWRLVNGSEAAPKFNFTTTAIIEAQVRQYTGVYTPSPIGATAHNQNGGSSTVITCGAVTTTAANSLAVNIATTGNTGSGNIPVPGTYTAEDTLNSNYSAADLTIASSGSSSGATSVTYTSSNYRVFTFELRSQAPVVPLVVWPKLKQYLRR